MTITKLERIPAKKTPDATRLLRADHKEVNDLFDLYGSTKSKVKKKEIVEKICTALTVHAQIEEEIFYPAVKLALKDKELIPEAAVEHAMLKTLIAQIEGEEPDGELFDAKVKVLGEYVKHHVKEEQSQIFVKAKESSKLDLSKLGEQLLRRKEELMSKLG